MRDYFDIDAIPGERWFPKETGFTEDLPLDWGTGGFLPRWIPCGLS